MFYSNACINEFLIILISVVYVRCAEILYFIQIICEVAWNHSLQNIESIDCAGIVAIYLYCHNGNIGIDQLWRERKRRSIWVSKMRCTLIFGTLDC